MFKIICSFRAAWKLRHRCSVSFSFVFPPKKRQMLWVWPCFIPSSSVSVLPFGSACWRFFVFVLFSQRIELNHINNCKGLTEILRRTAYLQAKQSFYSVEIPFAMFFYMKNCHFLRAFRVCLMWSKTLKHILFLWLQTMWHSTCTTFILVYLTLFEAV